MRDWLDGDKPVKETEKEYPGRNEKQETVKSSEPRKEGTVLVDAAKRSNERWKENIFLSNTGGH